MINNNSGQGELFNKSEALINNNENQKRLAMSKELIKDWQTRVYTHQAKCHKRNESEERQYSFFSTHENSPLDGFEPLDLTPLPLNFWKWPNFSHQGPAIYLVMDRPENKTYPLVLYIGETVSADKRWKGDHDCKIYLSHYCESLQKAGIRSQLSIRFWVDVPHKTRQRRELEKELIKKWLPPFNKETRTFWKTPFTTQLT